MELPENAQRFHVNERGKKSTYDVRTTEDIPSIAPCMVDSPNRLVKLHKEAQVKLWFKDINPPYR